MSKKLKDMFLSIGLLVIGICLLLWAEKVTNTVAIILGIVAIIYSLTILIPALKNKKGESSEIALAAILFIVGLVLLIKPGIIGETISFVIGIFLIIMSASKLKDDLDLKKNKNNNLGLILTIVGFVLGLLCILGKLIIPDLVLKFIGVILIIYSATNIINTIILPNKK